MSPSEWNDCAAAGLDHWYVSEVLGDSKEPQDTRQRANSENVVKIMAVKFFITKYK
jgi:hypothetical protein